MTRGRHAPRFWWRSPPTPLARLLAPAGHIYGRITASRMDRAPASRAQTPVLCVGNLVAGGTGKTPFALMLAEVLAAHGARPVFLLRGYGGRLTGPVRVDAGAHTAQDVGDEALLLAARAPTVVAADRGAGARLAETLGDVIVMDDGFQNPTLYKDLALVLVDAATGIGNGLCLPAGPLRAPLAAQLPHADAVIRVGTGEAAAPVMEAARRLGRPVLQARVAAVDPQRFAGRKAVVFAGIGRPDKVFDTLAATGAEIVARHAFGDHHVYAEAEARMLIAEAERHDACLVTTTKDRVRLAGAASGALAELHARAQTLDVALRMDDPDALVALLPAGALPQASRPDSS
ncbi:tetraacyldisaccharide 4'-kinase [Stappia sp.]|uniref:tetraacyldisaccharide 4'-kinase n=1 Tax=Stappia sp. TaxID=1870903 RepID=UPI0032D8E628